VGDEAGSSALSRLFSVPGLVAVAVLGSALFVLARLFGPGDVLRVVLTELVASFGTTILVLAVVALFFRSGLERLLRRAPGGETLAASVEHLGELLRNLDPQELNERLAGFEARLERITEEMRSISESELPALRREVRELRGLLADSQRERDS
jgi:hypothetical protein